MLLLTPVIKDFLGLEVPMLRALAFSLVLILGLGSLQASKLWFRVGIALMIIGVLLNVLAVGESGQGFLIAALLCFFAFLIMMTATAMRHVVFSREVSWNRIVGAVCVYLLLGTLWSTTYLLLHVLDSGSFRGVTASVARVGLIDFQYYSFVTLTTLGYGDIVPVSSTAKALAYLEAIVGQLYIAILVAGLVGAYIAEHQEKRED